MSFYAPLDGGTKVVFAFIPKDSQPERGLRYHVYSKRLARLFRTTEEIVASILPEGREDYVYAETPDDDMQGYAGYFSELPEVRRFLMRLYELGAGYDVGGEYRRSM